MTTHETSYPFLFDRFYATILVEYELDIDTAQIVEYLEVKVTSLVGDDWTKDLEELEASGWADWLNEKVTDECLRNIDDEEWLKWELIDDE